jgi:hypothetical protein
MVIIVYVVCAAIGYALGQLLPESAATPYVPILVSYHFLLLYLIVYRDTTGEQKAGLSMPLPLAILTHLAFLGAVIGYVFGRHHMPLFGLVQYAVPSIAIFEAKWLFESNKPQHVSVEPANMPEGTHDDYAEFTAYLRGKRTFQRAGRSVNEEFALWRAARDKRRHAAL